jgi:ParB-like chromosome segregation protein Spo0J
MSGRKKKNPDGTIEWKLDQLKEHEFQSDVYKPRPQWQIDALAKDMAANGLNEPVEITSDGTIISGHGRVAAAKMLGWKTIRCRVRADLEAEGPDAVKQRLLEANLNRRHLSKLAQARHYQELLLIERRKTASYVKHEDVKGDLRDKLAVQFGTSGRTLDRRLLLLKLPPAVQHAVDDERLPLTLALRLWDKDKAVVAGVARAIEDGENPIAAVRAALTVSGPRNTYVTSDVSRLVRVATETADRLNGRESELRLGSLIKKLDDLRAGRDLFNRLIALATGG